MKIRLDKKGKIHTLDEDYVRVWKEHGIDVVRVEVGKEDGLPFWKIYGKFRKNL